LWFLSQVSAKDDLAGTIALYRAGMDVLRKSHKDFISAEQSQEAEARMARFAAPGVPDDLARDIGLLPLMGVAPEIAQLARATGHELAPVAALYFGVGARLGLDRLRLLAARITASEHWDRLAIRRLVDVLFAAQRALSQSLLATLPKTATADHALKALADWAALQAGALERTRSFLGALETTGELSIAKLTLANSQIHKLADI
jgi:glutamate dehydrogenase